MNKILLIIAVFLTLWMGKLTFDIYNLREQNLTLLNESLEQQNQRIAKLNDQLVALQGQRAEPIQQTTSTIAASTLQTYSAQNYVQDRVQFIQLLLQQQYFVEALEQIQTLKKHLIEQNLLSSSLNQTLIEALNKDQIVITSYTQERSEHIQILQQQLQQIEQALQVKPLAQTEDNWQLSSWFRIGKAEKTPDLYHRSMYFKQLQLQILIAQQALYAGQIPFYHAQLREIVEGLSRYPDSTARRVVTNIQQLDARVLSAPPQLSALVLMQE